ncbi:MAG TPA: hypothetical protein VER12_02035 [Polyangiaceae bacterium]|nr:hypothetical protein [Polyangiaceae bacterium]HYQ30030.1 hypothetical protein [Polyangiaceae bacterium]
MRFRTHSLASLIGCAILLLPRMVRAEPSSAEIYSAKHAFETALAAEAEQRWADAALKLREAIAVKDTPGLRFHLAHCETELGRLVEASLEYDRALELMRRGAKAPDVQKLLAPARSELLERIPRLSLDLPSDVQVPLISIDQQPYPASELSLGVPLNPGPHELRVQAAGRRAFARALSLKEGDRITLPVALPVLPPNSGPSEADPPPVRDVNASSRSAGPASEHHTPSGNRPSGKLYLMIGEAVLTAAGLGVGIGYAVARGAATDRADSAQALIDEAAPESPTACDMPDAELAGACSDLSAAVKDHDRAAFLSQVGFVTAGVGAVSLLTTWLIYPTPGARQSGFSVQPAAGLGRIGLVGRF